MNRGAPRNGTTGEFLVALTDGLTRTELGVVGSGGEANDLLAAVPDVESGDSWLVFVGSSPQAVNSVQAQQSHQSLQSLVGGVDQDTVMLVTAAEIEAHSAPAASVFQLAGWLRSSSSTTASQPGPVVAVRCRAVLAVGGFDATAVGLGLADLATRLRIHGRTVFGAPDDPVALQDLEPQLSISDQLRSAAIWFRRYGEPGDFGRFRRRVMSAAAVGAVMAWFRIGATGRATMTEVFHDARLGWPSLRPDETQQGVGQRADWRFLVGDRPVTHLLLAGPPAEGPVSVGPDYLQADGWAGRVSFGPVSLGRPDDGGADVPAPDVVVIQLGASVAEALGDVVSSRAGPPCTVVMELDRGPLGRLRRVRALLAAGFEPVALYLVTPDLGRAKRYVALNQPEAIGWLLAPPPPVEGVSTGLRRVARRLLVRAVSSGIAAAASLPVVSALAGSGQQGLVVAARGDRFEPPPVLMTSGHDEGSRAVLVSLGSEGERAVTKMSPRPRYNGNADNEAEVVQAVRAKMRESGAHAAAALLPVVKPGVTVGDLRGAREAYAGRWTASDLFSRVPGSRVPVLHRVLAAIDELSLATVDRTEPWSVELFERYVGRLFERYREVVGRGSSGGGGSSSSSTGGSALDEFEAVLRRRSEEMVGSPMPLVQRHYDLGPWNVVFADDGSGLTIIDWELAPPRELGQVGLCGADQLYFVKYWLHIVQETTSVDDEQLAFEFLAGDHHEAAAEAFGESLRRLGVDHRFVPLLAGHLWLEAALYTATRRAEHGGDPGSAANYLETLAARRQELLQFWS